MDKLRLQPIPLQHRWGKDNRVKEKTSTSLSFKEQLHAVTGNSLKVSKHASERLEERKIQLTHADWQRVADKVFEAKSKGVKESLVLMDQAALIVSAKNATVITAMDRTEVRDQVFTNIDGTIVLN